MAWGDDLRPLLMLSQAGLVVLTASGLGYLAGDWADARWGTSPWLAIIGVGLGIAAGLTEIFRQAKKLR